MKIGLIGFGNMGSAIGEGLLQNGHRLYVSTLETYREEKDIKFTTEEEIAEKAEYIFLCIKPQQFRSYAADHAGLFKNKHIISIAAGIPIAQLKQLFPGNSSYTRLMPNTPAQILEGVTGICFEDTVDHEVQETIFSLVSTFSLAIQLSDEDAMHDFIAMSGSSPAFVFYMVEAAIQSAVDAFGISYDEAYTIFSQIFYGSAKLIMESEEPPKQLRERVTSKEGTTERGLNVLMDGRLEAILKETFIQTSNRSVEMEEVPLEQE